MGDKLSLKGSVSFTVVMRHQTVEIVDPAKHLNETIQIGDLAVSMLKTPSPYSGTSVSTWARTSSLPGAAAIRRASPHASCAHSEKSVATTMR